MYLIASLIQGVLIGKKVAEVVIRNNYNADINFVLLKAVPEMHDITYQ